MSNLGVADIIDITVVAILLYGVAMAFRGTRSAFVFTGIVIVSGLYLLARFSGLRLVAFLFQGFFTVILVALIVIFQEEIRRIFERVAVSGPWRRERKKATEPFLRQVEVLVSTLNDLARERIGALIVLEDEDVVALHVQGGVPLDGRLSEPVLKSLFDPHSIGHDGAVIISGAWIRRFGCHLPLSTNADKLHGLGTRHAAALGLAERTDAICLVVSEERGTITVARNGHLTLIADAASLTRLLEDFYRKKSPGRGSGRRMDFLRRNILQKLAAIALAAALWFLFVHESAIEYRSFSTPVRDAGLRPGLVVESTTPPSVNVIVSGSRRTFYFFNPQRLELTANLFQSGVGDHIITLTASDLRLPEGLTFVNIVPRTVQVKVVEQPRPPPQTR